MEIDPALFEENERTAPAEDGRRFFKLGETTLRRGGVLPEVEICYQTWGNLNPARDNAILVCHALSGDANVLGWWERLFGPGKAIDPNEFYIIGVNALGGCQGTTGPASLAPDGRPWGSRFPQITVEDMADRHADLLDHLEIPQLRLVAGGSMGGMQALALATLHPDRVAKCWMTASCAAHSALQIAFNELGRQAILRDPKFLGGDYSPENPPSDGLSVARMAGHISYLSEASFEAKFGRRRQVEGGEQFAVESYLSYQGDKFTHRFDANSYLVLTRAIDEYECNCLGRAQCEFLLTSFTSDWLYPSHQSRTLWQNCQDIGLVSNHVEIDAPFGHDSFLLETVQQGDAIRRFLKCSE